MHVYTPPCREGTRGEVKYVGRPAEIYQRSFPAVPLLFIVGTAVSIGTCTTEAPECISNSKAIDTPRKQRISKLGWPASLRRLVETVSADPAP